MKSVLISIQPKWCELIAIGEKTLEVRKARPKLETPFKCYIYCAKRGDRFWVLDEISKMEYGVSAVCANLKDTEGASLGNGKVIGEFTCDAVYEYCYQYCPHPEIGMDYDCGDNWWEIDDKELNRACLTEREFRLYASGNSEMYGWHISNLKIYDKPKELNEFYVLCDRCDKKAIRCEYGYEENTENGYYSECMCDFKRPIKHPPQSWCYVEELQSMETG